MATVKRAFDFSVAFAAMVMTSPIVGAAALAVKLSSPGPAFYKGPRVGRGGRRFEIFKLRTMRHGAERSGPPVTAGDDPRLTAVGRVLRRTKVDELPQLWNVVRGDMSLVGPRPEHPAFVEHYTHDQRRLLDVRPGMTGVSALAYIDEEQELKGGPPEQKYIDDVMPQKLGLELNYLEHASFRTDMGVLLKTAALLLRRPFPAGG